MHEKFVKFIEFLNDMYENFGFQKFIVFKQSLNVIEKEFLNVFDDKVCNLNRIFECYL